MYSVRSVIVYVLSRFQACPFFNTFAGAPTIMSLSSALNDDVSIERAPIIQLFGIIVPLSIRLSNPIHT